MSSPALSTVTSPCIGVCMLDDANYCQGCRRHINEIAGWMRLSEEERRRILDELPLRHAKVASARQ
ncbi:MAG TPA: DUF1289 domain-containing protein [Gammaproteobacteria bacterium]|nr:DUF1289 domain-containing protein [Gammaproteobacteria bacterium]